MVVPFLLLQIVKFQKRLLGVSYLELKFKKYIFCINFIIQNVFIKA